MLMHLNVESTNAYLSYMHALLYQLLMLLKMHTGNYSSYIDPPDFSSNLVPSILRML